MFRYPTRVLFVNDVQYIETIPDTLYRSKGGQIILMKSRGKNSKGAIKGKRFMAYVLSPEGKYKKMRGVKGTVRYFETPFDAAVEAATFHRQTRESWLKTAAIANVEELALEASRLRLAIEQARRELSDLQGELGSAQRLRVQKTSTVDSDVDPSSAAMRLSGIACLPEYLKRAAAKVVTSRSYH